MRFERYDILVNRLHPYHEEDYQGIKMVEVKDIEGNLIEVEQETYKHYLLFKQKLQELDINVSISSGYRTLAEQQQIIDEFSSRYPQEEVDKRATLMEEDLAANSGINLSLIVSSNTCIVRGLSVLPSFHFINL